MPVKRAVLPNYVADTVLFALLCQIAQDAQDWGVQGNYSAAPLRLAHTGPQAQHFALILAQKYLTVPLRPSSPLLGQFIMKRIFLYVYLCIVFLLMQLKYTQFLHQLFISLCPAERVALIFSLQRSVNVSRSQWSVVTEAELWSW